MRKTIQALAALLLVLGATGLVAGQSPDAISLGFVSALPLIIGQTSVITVTVTNIVNSTVELSFLGVRFEWDRPPSWYVGGGSDSGAVLSAGQQINYQIPVAIPSNVTAGMHRLTTYVTYRWLNDGNWTGLIAGFWVTDFPFTYTAQTQSAGPLQMSSMETIAALFFVAGLAIFLERGHIRRLKREFRKMPPEQPTSAEPEIGEPPAKEREEQEV